MICIGNIEKFFDCNPEFEDRREEVLRQASYSSLDGGVILEESLPILLGDLEMAFHWDMDHNPKQIRVFAQFLGKKEAENQ